MKKIILALVAVLLVILGGYALSKDYFINGEADLLQSFSGWKSYSSKSVGFSFKYPAEWIVDDSFPNVVSFTSATGANAFGAYREKLSNKKQTLSQWLKARDKENREAMGGQYNDYVIISKPVKVARLSAIRRKEHADAAGFDFIQTYVKSGDFAYMFALGVGSGGFYTPAEEKTYDAILSTVKFIK